MQLQLIALGKRMPGWVDAGVAEYTKRFPPEFQISLVELAIPKRVKQSNIEQLREQEAKQILQTIPSGNIVVLLDERGQQWDSVQLSKHLQQWRDESQNISFIIGGPDGLAPTCFQHADKTWSLSKLTLPHALVRIVVMEQLYRAWSITNRHPYHR